MKRIIVTGLNKEFRLSRKGGVSALGRILGLFSPGRRDKKIRVADRISFDADQGENIGVIGLNGSGKSTLLRLIAEIYRPDSGSIRTEGSLAYLAGFGQGLQPLLTMRENIHLMGALMGLSPADIREKFGEIVEFSGLAEFVDARVYQFSAGADMDFQTRALAKMSELIHGGATVLLVSHHLETVRKYCDRVIWMEKGKIVRTGGADEVIDAYLQSKQKKAA